jgi:hypothetical protein
MEGAFVEIDKRIYFGSVEDGCGWIENRLDSRSTRAACAAIRTLSAAANDLMHFARDNYRMLPIISKHQRGTVQSVLAQL